jgi:hypothetical protein
MFGIGLQELVIILVVALIILTSAATGSDHSTTKVFKRFSAKRVFSGALEHHFPRQIRARVECAADPLRIVLNSPQ